MDYMLVSAAGLGIHHTLPANVDSGRPEQAHNEFEKLHTYGEVVYFIRPIKGSDKIVAWHCKGHQAAIHLTEIYKYQSSFFKAAAQNLYLWNLKENEYLIRMAAYANHHFHVMISQNTLVFSWSRSCWRLQVKI